MSEELHHHRAGWLQVSDTPDAVTTAVFMAALMAKGAHFPANDSEALRESFLGELREMGLNPSALPPPHPSGTYSLQHMVLIRLPGDGQERREELAQLRLTLCALGIALGLLIDFKASLMVDGITRVNLRDGDS